MAFHKLDIDKLKTAAERWAKDIKKDLEVSISKITLYDYRLNIDIQSKMGNVSDNLHINLPRYAMIFEILCPGGVEDYPRSCPYKAIDDFVFRFTNYMAAARVDIPAFAVNDIKESYKSTIPENYQAEWEFLPHCTAPGCGGIEISAAARTDEPFAVLYDSGNLVIPGQKNTIPEQLKPCSFHALDIPFLRSIASRWGNDYREEGVLIDRITLHPLGIPPSLKEVLHHPVKDHKYAVMFHCPECTSDDLSIQDTAADILDKISGDGFSPYHSLFSATQERGSGSILFYESFENVYLKPPPEGWQKEWRFVLLYSGAVVGCDVWQDTGIELYKVGITFRTKEDHQTANPITDIKNIESTAEHQTPETLPIDNQLWKFQCIGAEWRITFEGQLYSIKNRAPVSYMLPLIKQPGKPFEYVNLCQIVKGENTKNIPQKEKGKKEAGDVSDDESAYEDGLHDQISLNEFTEKDVQAIINLAQNFYPKYLSDVEGKLEEWSKIKKYSAENGVLIKDSGGKLSFYRSKYQGKNDNPKFTKALNNVSQNRIRFLEMIKESPSSEKLHQHFKQCLKPEKGYIQYRPPDGSPLWKIIE